MYTNIPFDYDDNIYIQFCNKMKSEYYGNSRYFSKEGITLYHFKCQTYGNSEHIISEVIIDHVLYYFMSYSSDKYAANTAAQIKL